MATELKLFWDDDFEGDDNEDDDDLTNILVLLVGIIVLLVVIEVAILLLLLLRLYGSIMSSNIVFIGEDPFDLNIVDIFFCCFFQHAYVYIKKSENLKKIVNI